MPSYRALNENESAFFNSKLGGFSEKCHIMVDCERSNVYSFAPMRGADTKSIGIVLQSLHLGDLEITQYAVTLYLNEKSVAELAMLQVNPNMMGQNPNMMGQNPYMANPYMMGQNPYMANPYMMGQNPYMMGQNPYMMNPYAAQQMQGGAQNTSALLDQIKQLGESITKKLGEINGDVEVSEESIVRIKNRRILAEKMQSLISCGDSTFCYVNLKNYPVFYGYMSKDEIERQSKELKYKKFKDFLGGKTKFDYMVHLMRSAYKGSSYLYVFGDSMRYKTGYDSDQVHCGNVISYDLGAEHIAWVESDGVVHTVGKNTKGQRGASGFVNCTKVACGKEHTVALKKDGTVIASGDNEYGQCNVSGWKDIVDVVCGEVHTLGLRSNGTVASCGHNGWGKLDVTSWTDIVALSTSGTHTLGLKADGTVVAAGNNNYGQSEVSSWRDIIAVAASYRASVGLKMDGTLVKCGSGLESQSEFSKIKLFDSPFTRDDESARSIAEEERKEEEEWEKSRAKWAREAEERKKAELLADRRRNGVCTFCGGSFKGVFSKVCSRCARPKNY